LWEFCFDAVTLLLTKEGDDKSVSVAASAGAFATITVGVPSGANVTETELVTKTETVKLPLALLWTRGCRKNGSKATCGIIRRTFSFLSKQLSAGNEKMFMSNLYSCATFQAVRALSCVPGLLKRT
jgi:hypothetical protein